MINLKPAYYITFGLTAILAGMAFAGAPIPWYLVILPAALILALTAVLAVLMLVQVFTVGGKLTYTLFGRVIFTVIVK